MSEMIDVVLIVLICVQAMREMAEPAPRPTSVPPTTEAATPWPPALQFQVYTKTQQTNTRPTHAHTHARKHAHTPHTTHARAHTHTHTHTVSEVQHRSRIICTVTP